MGRLRTMKKRNEKKANASISRLGVRMVIIKYFLDINSKLNRTGSRILDPGFITLLTKIGFEYS